jgi:hypothetical protein
MRKRDLRAIKYLGEPYCTDNAAGGPDLSEDQGRHGAADEGER